MAEHGTSRMAKWGHAAGLDFHVVVTLLFRGWSVLVGAAMLVLLPLYLDPVELGYYYTFASILGLQIFFELGMNQVVLQITSHEIAHLEMGTDGALRGDARRIARLAALAGLLRRWYATAAALFALVVSAAGVTFFLRHHDLVPTHWLGPWLALCAATAANLYLAPSLAMIEGSGRVGDVARLRLLQSMAGYGLLAAMLAAGSGLWSAPAVPLAAAAGSATWLRHRGRLVAWLRAVPDVPRSAIDWRREILPFQWRIALSWVSGYFIFQLFTPLVFDNLGARPAGQFGIVLAVFNAIQSIGMSWVYSKGPAMASAVSRSARSELKAVFLRALWPSTAFTAAACLLVVGCVWAATRAGLAFVQRLSSLEVVAWIALVTVVNAVIFAAAVFMRSHKEEPLMLPSVVLAAIVIAVAHFASRRSVELTAELYCAATTLVSLPWTLLLLRRYWHRA